MTEAPPGADRSRAATMWRSALRQGILPFAVVLGLGVAVAALRAAGRASLGDALGQAALVPALVHRVPVEVGPITVRLALLLATVAAGWLLYRGGRAVASGTGAPAASRAIHGATVAIPYAVGSFLVSLTALWAPFRSVADVDAAIPSILGSFTWPLLLGTASGAAGGVSARPAHGPIERRARAAVAGGWRMAWLSVALGTTAVLVVLALNPGPVRAALDAAFQRGPAAGTLILAGTAAVLPNAGTGAAAAAMGAGVELEALGASCTVISYTRFPGGGGATGGPCGPLPFAVGSTPAGYLLFLLIPLAGTVAGGTLAARRGGAESVRDGALIGAAAGVIFAMTFAGWCVVSRLVYEATGPAAVLVSDLHVAAGPDPVAAFLLGLAWGPVGGAAGGWWMARTKRTMAAGPDHPGPARDVGSV